MQLSRIELFLSNIQEIKKGVRWQSAMMRRLAALLCAMENQPASGAAVKESRDLIKENVGVFSMFRGDLSLYMATMLSLREGRAAIVANTLDVYDLLKDAKFRASEYLTVAAFQIAVNTEPSQFGSAVERCGAFYKGMKDEHWWLTGEDDYIFAAMLGLSEMNVADGLEQMEGYYQRLKPELKRGEGVQALAQVLAVSGQRGQGLAVERILALRNALRDRNIRMDKTYTLPALGVLALLPADIETIVGDIEETQAFLRGQKGFGRWSVTQQELLLHVSAIVSSGYMDDLKRDIVTAALATSLTSILIAQQTTLIIAASAAAASSAAASN